LIGEGEAFLQGKRLNRKDALQQAGLAPLVLEAKEAISLINGTQGMLAVGTLALLAAETLADSADLISAMSLDALKRTDVAFDERIHLARPHAGQVHVAAKLRRLLVGSKIRESHKECGRVQDAYSLRCIPKVHGAVRDTLEFCRKTFATEMNSAVDNPLVFVKEHAEGDIISGGNFHGEPLAFALDYLAIALAIDFLAPLKTSKPLQEVHAAIRKVSPVVDHDRVMAGDFAKVADLLRSATICSK
jgi:histidine ammonia-lyase